MPRTVRIIAFGFGLLGAVAASQGPEFAQQYRQRLGGAIDELKRAVERFDADAAAHGETRESAIDRLKSNPDSLASRQGAAMEAGVARLGRLESHRQEMIQAGSFARIVLVIRKGDGQVIEAAYRDFEPAVPVTEEGIVAGAAGFVGAWGGTLLLAAALRRLWRRKPRPVRA